MNRVQTELFVNIKKHLVYFSSRKGGKNLFLANKFNILQNRFIIFQKQPPEVFYKKGVLENSPKFTGEHLCQSLLFNI